MPGKSFPSADWMDWFKLDKWIHAFLYLSLFILGYIPLKERKGERYPAKIIFLLLYCLGLGAFTELIQELLLEDRSGDIPDLVANSTGVIFAVVLVRLFDKNWPWKPSIEETVSLGE